MKRIPAFGFLMVFLGFMFLSSIAFAGNDSGIRLVNIPLSEDEQLWFGQAQKFRFETPMKGLKCNVRIDRYKDGKHAQTLNDATLQVNDHTKFIVWATPIWTLDDRHYDLLRVMGMNIPIETAPSGMTTWLFADSQEIGLNKEIVLAVGLYGATHYDGRDIIPGNKEATKRIVTKAPMVYVISCRIFDK